LEKRTQVHNIITVSAFLLTQDKGLCLLELVYGYQPQVLSFCSTPMKGFSDQQFDTTRGGGPLAHPSRRLIKDKPKNRAKL